MQIFVTENPDGTYEVMPPGGTVRNGRILSAGALKQWALRAPGNLFEVGIFPVDIPDAPDADTKVDYVIEKNRDGVPVAVVTLIDKNLEAALTLRAQLESIGMKVPTEQEARDSYAGRKG